MKPQATIVGSDENLERKLFVRIARRTDEFEGYPRAHAERIAMLAAEIGIIFNLASKDRQSLQAAALLHDVGEAAMARDYIQRVGSLTDAERLDLERHTVIGEQEAARTGADRATQLIIRWHHEWWNGGGYPDALRREEIPLAARILRVADSYASMRERRPFRPALTESEARARLAAWAGIEFDPRVVEALLMLGPFPDFQSLASAAEPTTNEKPDAADELFASFRR